jgi:hypothetical protein
MRCGTKYLRAIGERARQQTVDTHGKLTPQEDRIARLPQAPPTGRSPRSCS